MIRPAGKHVAPDECVRPCALRLLQNKKATQSGGLLVQEMTKFYCATPAGACGTVPAAVAAAASFRIR